MLFSRGRTKGPPLKIVQSTPSTSGRVVTLCKRQPVEVRTRVSVLGTDPARAPGSPASIVSGPQELEGPSETLAGQPTCPLRLPLPLLLIRQGNFY